MKTRKQYINKECTHREYYAQFVTEDTKRAVLYVIGKDKLLSSKDEHLNDIGLKTWDSIGVFGVGAKLKECGDYLTLAGAVCINKEAARQIIESDSY